MCVWGESKNVLLAFGRRWQGIIYSNPSLAKEGDTWEALNCVPLNCETED